MLSIKMLSENFDVINELYFNNELQKPKFEITHVKGYLGQYEYRYSYNNDKIFSKSIIRISDRYDRTDNDIVNTLAHEMIHLYIRQNKIKDTRPHHGKVFYSVANRLNREGGFNISRTDSVEGCGLRNKTDKVYYVGCFYSGRAKKYFRFAMNKNYIQYFIKCFEYYPHHYVKPIIFKTTDDKTFANYTECRKSVRGWYVEEFDYNYHLETDEIIYQINPNKSAA